MNMRFCLIFFLATLGSGATPVSTPDDASLVIVHSVGSQLYLIISDSSVTVKVIDSTQNFVREVFPLTPETRRKIKTGLQQIPNDYFGYAFINDGVIDGFRVVLSKPDWSAGPAHSILVSNIFVRELEPFFSALDEALPKESRFRIRYVEGAKWAESSGHHRPEITKMKMEDYLKMDDTSDLPRTSNHTAKPTSPSRGGSL
jgi:hypothetical protein